MKRTIQFIAAGLMTLSLTLHFSACTEQSPLASVEDDVQDSGSLSKTKGRAGYPQYAERTFVFQNQGYNGVNIQIPGGTSFYASNRSLTPPEGTPHGADVTITMLVEKVRRRGKKMLELTFGPHGSSFRPQAQVTFDYTDLGIDVGKLYYIDESGKYVAQTPDNIDVQNKRMTIYLNHFSRYAIGAE